MEGTSADEVSLTAESSPTTDQTFGLLETSILDYTPIFNPDPRKLCIDLRVQRSERIIKLLVIVTVYSEPGHMLTSTLNAVAANVAGLDRKGWSWENIMVLVVVDGLEKASASLLKVAEEKMGLMHSSALQGQALRGKTVVHLFESTRDFALNDAVLPTRASRKHRLRWANGAKTTQRVQMAFCLKARNGGKLNSHMWGMLGIARLLNPKYVMTIDVGTVPVPSNFVALMTRMEDNPDIGGAAGEIVPAMYNRCNGTAAAQDFEYWASSFLDKATEAFFGYISVLPGALSVYRWSAMLGPPLASYFKLESMPAADISPFSANLYLAEDRILAFNILAKKDKAWFLDFVPEAVAYTDVPEQLDSLVKQRRRWTNGALFNLIYYLMNVDLHFLSAHNFGRKIMFFLLAMFNMGFALLSYIAVGLLFITYLIIFNAWFSEFGDEGNTYSFILSGFIAAQIFLVFLVGTIGNVSEQKHILIAVSHAMSVLNVSGLVVGTWVFFQSGLSLLIVAGTLKCCLFANGCGSRIPRVTGVFGFFLAFLIVSLVWCNPSRLITAFPFYILKVPSFVTIFTIFSVSNIHDSSWGTKEGQLSQEKFRSLQSEASSIQNKADKLLSAVFALMEFAADGQGKTDLGRTSQEDAVLSQAIHAAAGLLARSLQEVQNAQSQTTRSSVMSVGQVVEHHANDFAPPAAQEPTSAEHIRVMQILERMTSLCEADKVVIMESLDVYQAHRAAAKAAEKAAAGYAIDAAKVKARFSAFRFQYVCLWVFFNMALVAIVDSFSMEAAAAGALAVAVLVSSGFRIFGSVFFRVQTSISRAWRRVLRPRCCVCAVAVDKRTLQKRCASCYSPDLIHREHEWLDEQGLLVDPCPFHTGSGPAPARTVQALSHIKVKADNTEPNRDIHSQQTYSRPAGSGSSQTGSAAGQVSTSRLTDPRQSHATVLSTPTQEASTPMQVAEENGMAMLPSPPRIDTGEHRGSASSLSRSAAAAHGVAPTNGMFMFWTAPQFGSDNEYDSDASTQSDLDEEVLCTPAHSRDTQQADVRRVAPEAGSTCAPLSDDNPSPGIAPPVHEHIPRLLPVHGRDPQRWVAARAAGPSVRQPWSRPPATGAASSEGGAVSQSRGLYLRDHSRSSFVQHREEQRLELFDAPAGAGAPPQRRRQRRGSAQVQPHVSARRIVAIASPAHSSDSPMVAVPRVAHHVPGTPDALAARTPDTRGNRRVSMFRLPSIGEEDADLLSRMPAHGRRMSFLAQASADGPLGSTAQSFMRAIETGYNPLQHGASSASGINSPVVHSQLLGHDAQSLSPEQAADHARRTLLQCSAADYSDRVTRAAYKQTHGRRMSTLRNMHKKITSGTTPTAAERAAPVPAAPTKKMFPGAGHKQ